MGLLSGKRLAIVHVIGPKQGHVLKAGFIMATIGFSWSIHCRHNSKLLASAWNPMILKATWEPPARASSVTVVAWPMAYVCITLWPALDRSGVHVCEGVQNCKSKSVGSNQHFVHPRFSWSYPLNDLLEGLEDVSRGNQLDEPFSAFACANVAQLGVGEHYMVRKQSFNHGSVKIEAKAERLRAEVQFWVREMTPPPYLWPR